MRFSKGIAHLLLLVIVIVAAMGGIGYYAYQNGRIRINQQKPVNDIKESSPTPTSSLNAEELETKELATGEIQVTNTLGNFEVTAPNNYTLSGDAKNFTLSFNGPGSSRPGPNDFAKIQFRIFSQEEKTLEEQVRKDYASSQMNEGGKVNYNDIKDFSLGGSRGYSYSCPFLVLQNCIYLPLDKNNYLLILTSFEDESSSGYKKEIETILSTFKLTKHITATPTNFPIKSSFPVTFTKPESWKLVKNAPLQDINLPNYGGSTNNNLIAHNEEGCALYLGFGGAQGPTEEITNEDVTIGDKAFTKRIWYENGKPIFISYIPQTYIPGFELLWAFIPKTDAEECMKSIDLILSTFEFIR
jgi:hypothetical protein